MTRKTDTGNPELGFTIIELMVVLAIAAILIVIAAPSFAEFLSRRRVEGVMSELVTDVHYARSEAVSRNAPVRLTLGTGCYVIHLASASATAVNCSITPPAAEIKTVLIDTTRLTMSPDPNTLTYVEFDPVRGTAVNSEGASTASVELRSKTGTIWRLRAVTTIMGRVATCSPSGAGHLSGYPSDCS